MQARVKDERVGFVNLTDTMVEPGEEAETDHHLLSRGWATWTLVRAPVADHAEVDLRRVDLAEVVGGAVDISAGTVMSPGKDHDGVDHRSPRR